MNSRFTNYRWTLGLIAAMAMLLVVMSQGTSADARKTLAVVVAPDLIVSEISFEPAASKIRVRVTNHGNTTSSPCYMALQSLVGVGVSLPTKQRVWTVQVPALEAGKGMSQVIDVAPLTQSNGPWKATVDRSNLVAESNEGNNSLTYPTGNEGPKADLIIQSFELIDPANGSVKINIVNKGTADSKECSLRLIVWEPGQFEQKEAKTVFVKVQGLHPSHSQTVIAAAGVSIINTKYSMFIDIGNDVPETNENNNRAEGEAGNFKP